MPVHFGNRLAIDEEPKEKREVDAAALRKSVPTPNTRIDVENLVLTISKILSSISAGGVRDARRRPIRRWAAPRALSGMSE